MNLSCKNNKINDISKILNVLIVKETNISKRIGEPALLMGKLNFKEEEEVTSLAIESGLSADYFSLTLDQLQDKLHPIESMMASRKDTKTNIEISDIKTIFSDRNYIKTAISCILKYSKNRIFELKSTPVLEIFIPPDLREWLNSTLPSEVVPENAYLQFTSDKKFYYSQLDYSQQLPLSNRSSVKVWPRAHLLWKLHPLFNWLNYRCSLLYGRNEVPILGISKGLEPSELLYIIAGTIPNRKSAPLVDECFGILYKEQTMIGEFSLEDLIAKIGLEKGDLSNTNSVNAETIDKASTLLTEVILDARKILDRHLNTYNVSITPKINAELLKLADRKERHRSYLISSVSDEGEKTEKLRETDRLFDNLSLLLRDTLEIENTPSIRVISVLAGVEPNDL
jgi:hypothetical protein